jgi:hypothetical protein
MEDGGGARTLEVGSGAARPRLGFKLRLHLVRLRHLVVHGVECMSKKTGGLQGGEGVADGRQQL